jgi:hypothetical protein
MKLNLPGETNAVLKALLPCSPFSSVHPELGLKLTSPTPYLW